MDSICKPPSRSGNFSSFEKDIVFALIESHKGVLESKKTDAISVLAKKQTWMALADQFNAVNGVCKRSYKQLRLSLEIDPSGVYLNRPLKLMQTCIYHNLTTL